MLTEKQKPICDRYSARDWNGYVHCAECPLVINKYICMCKGNAHYDRHRKEWIFDDEKRDGESI